MDFDLKLQFFATTTFLGGGSLIVTLYTPAYAIAEVYDLPK